MAAYKAESEEQINEIVELVSGKLSKQNHVTLQVNVWEKVCVMEGVSNAIVNGKPHSNNNNIFATARALILRNVHHFPAYKKQQHHAGKQ